MGTRCYLKSASETQISLIRLGPHRVAAFLGEDIAQFEEPDGPMFPRLTIPAELLEQVHCIETDLDKAWGGIHFLFTGTADEGELPEAFLLKGGEEIGPEGARVVSPADARLFNELVQSLSEDELRARFDPKRMIDLDVYSRDFWQGGREAGLSYVLSNLRELRSFTRDVVAAKQGYVNWII